jgi:calnexin
VAAISELKVEEEESEDDDYGLLLPREAQRYAATASLGSVVSLSDDEPLIIAYEVTLQRGLDCGGAYVKVFDDTVAVDAVSPASPYIIMFGPDKCGGSGKIHLIFRVRNPVDGSVEEKHLKDAHKIDGKWDNLAHLYVLKLQGNGTFEVREREREREARAIKHTYTPVLTPPPPPPPPTH